MTDLLRLSSDVIDGKIGAGESGPLNRINFELSEIADNVAMVEAFSHAVLFKTDAGLVTFDTSSHRGAGRVIKAIRGWSTEPFHSLIYTHGHIDHVGGCGAFLQDAEDRGHARPDVVGHENVQSRFAR
ncbi:MAG: MBL fold metallo-hydrolase, partial [Pseudomonadota bacterium]